MKYWNKARIKRVRDRERRREEARYERAERAEIAQRTYTRGDHEKNSSLMLEALGNTDRRNMVFRLKREGAMSLSKLAKPFRLKLSTAHAHIAILERSGIIATHKRGRVRMCVFRPESLKELSIYLRK